MFTGRNHELQLLNKLRNKHTASLVVITGRRRIGKSRLIQEFGQEFKRFIQFQGLAPREGGTNSINLNHFADQFSLHFRLPQVRFTNWLEAFMHLANQVQDQPTLLFLDEISWLGDHDPDFPGVLKTAWDTLFSKNPNIILVLCGSVSSWIEENILRDTQFVGRVSLTLRLKPLPLQSCSRFWGHRLERTSSLEILKVLTVTGAIPKYLEEIVPSDSAHANIERLCFTPGGYLFEDFDRIFSEVLGRRADTLGKIVRALANRKLSPAEIATTIGQTQGGELTRMMEILELAGFVARDFTFKADGRLSKLSQYRISDNYLRFYLKYVEPNNARIKQGLFQFGGLEKLVAWPSICGLQFENLVLQSIPELLRALNLEHEQVLSAAPYFQRATKRHQACQIDLLISCKSNSHYLCEIKFRKEINTKVIEEVRQKVKAIALPKHSSLRPVLIYAGELDVAVLEADYFDRILDFASLIKGSGI